MAGKILLVGSDADLALRKLGHYAHILNERYGECNSGGHKKPDASSGTCGYCYRQLRYRTPGTDSIREARREVPQEWQPLDTPFLLERERREIQLQEFCDWNSGIGKLKEELEAKANV
jgi:hypothetical protein